MKNRFDEMRYFLFVLLLILPVFAGAQTRVYVTQDQPQQIRQFRGGVDVLNYFRLPVQGGHSIPAGDSLWFVRVNPADSNVYMWNGLTWACMSCGSGGGADSSLFVTITRLIDSMNAMRSALADTSQAIRDDFPDVSGFVQYDDTANMLAPYVRSVVFLDSLTIHWVAIQGKQNQLNGTGFVKASGTTITYDNTVYVPGARTVTINGVSQDLSANRSWTVAGADTTALRNDITDLQDSIAVHRVDIDGKEPAITPGTTADYWRGDKTWQQFPAIPDISGLIPYSDTNTIIATKHDVDTAKQNIRDEIANIPAPPVTSVNSHTGDVVLNAADVGALAAGDNVSELNNDAGYINQTSGDARYHKQGGNAFGRTDSIGTTDNFRVFIITNGIPRIEAGSDSVVFRGARRLVVDPVIGGLHFYPPASLGFGNGVRWYTNGGANPSFVVQGVGDGNVYQRIAIATGPDQPGMHVFPTNNVSVGKTSNAGAKFEVQGTSATTGLAMRVTNSSSTALIEAYNSGRIRIIAPSYTGTVSSVYVPDGDSIKKASMEQIGAAIAPTTVINDTIISKIQQYAVLAGDLIEISDPTGYVIPSDNSLVVVTLTDDADMQLPNNPPVKSRAIVKVLGTTKTLTITPAAGGNIDGDPSIDMQPKDSYLFIHIGSNEWVVIGS